MFNQNELVTISQILINTGLLLILANIDLWNIKDPLDEKSRGSFIEQNCTVGKIQIPCIKIRFDVLCNEIDNR